MKAKYAGILAAVLGSICCIGPLLLVAVGLGVGVAVIGRYHWLFVMGAIAVLTWAWIKYFREKARCACEHRAMGGRGASLFTLLFASVIVLTFAGLNVRSYTFAGSPPAVPIARANLQRVIVPVEGITCVTCEIAVRNALKRVNGVASTHVSVATKNATVDYDPAKTNPDQIVAAINSTGYRASLTQK
ncbi:MAG TPA: mercuric transporter MerT family protein [Candidatus Udaeobacter sp.]|nr:mercuric transporter MerT family protein [Candidatus Udaeobacter sp.]